MATNSPNNLSNPISVPQGGTGDASLTAYAVLCGGTTSTTAIQPVASVGTSGQVLTSNGAGALPTFQTGSGGGSSAFAINVQAFNTTTTYTPTTGMKYCIIEAWGSGGGGGGGSTATAGQLWSAGGGGAGGYSRHLATDSDIGASKAVTVGNAGTGGASGGNNNGTAGNDVSVGTLCVAKGGSGGAFATVGEGVGGAGGVAGTGNIVAGSGQYGGTGIGGALITTINVHGGVGGSTLLGSGGIGGLNVSGSGGNGTGYGSGGGGASSTSGGSGAGGAGAKGYVIITEFCTTTTSAFSWNNVATSTQALAVGNGYITNNGASLVTYSLPGTAAQGTEIKIAGYSSGGFTITQAAGQSIIVGTTTSTVGVGGSVSSTVASNQLTLLCTVANTTWTVFNERGNFTVV